MAVDFSARGLVNRALAKHLPALEDFGGGTDKTVSQNRTAFRDAFATGASRIALLGGSYGCDAIPGTELVTNHTVGQQPAVILPPALKVIEGGDSALTLTHSRGIMAAPYRTWAFPAAMSYLASDVAAGATVFALEANEGSKWQAGDPVLWRFGSLPYDLPEPVNWGFAKVVSVSGDNVTIDRPQPQAFAIADVTGKSFSDGLGNTIFNKAIHKWPLTENLLVQDLTVIGKAGTTTENLLVLQGGRNITIRRCGGRNLGIGVSLQYVEGASISDCWFEDANVFQASVGKGIHLSECRAVQIHNFNAKGLKYCVTLEAGADATIQGGVFINTGNAATGLSWGSTCYVFQASGRSRLVVRDYTVTGHGGYVLGTTAIAGHPDYEGSIRFEGRLTLIHPAEPLSIATKNLACALDYRIAGGREMWDFANIRTWRRRIWLRDGMYNNIYGPPGMPRQMRITASSGLTFGAAGMVTGLYIGRTGDNGGDNVSALQAGKEVRLDNFILGFNGGQFNTRRAEQTKFLIITGASAGINAASEWIDIEVDYAADLLAAPFTWINDEESLRSNGQPNLRSAMFAAYNLPNIAAAATLQVDFAIPDVAAGDLVTSLGIESGLTGLSVRSADAIAGAVRVVFANQTAAAIDKAATNIRILWQKPL